MVRGFSVSVWLLALTAPFVGAATADATRDAASAMPQDGVTVTTVNYTIPPVHLVRETGQSVLLTQELDDGRPVIMNFIFTTCETTCPLSSQTFAQLQSRLGPADRRAHLVPLSRDPEHGPPPPLP